MKEEEVEEEEEEGRRGRRRTTTHRISLRLPSSGITMSHSVLNVIGSQLKDAYSIVIISLPTFLSLPPLLSLSFFSFPFIFSFLLAICIAANSYRRIRYF